MKPKFSPEDIKTMKFVDYRKSLYKELKRLKSQKPGTKVSYILLGEYEFSDFPGKKLPMLVIGNLTGEWERFYKTEGKKRSERDFSKGECSFGELEKGLTKFNLMPSHGKVKPRAVKALDKAVFKKVKLATNLVKGAVEAVAEVASTAKEKVKSVAKAVKNKAKQTKEEVVNSIKEHAKTLKSDLNGLKGDFKKIKSGVAKKIKKGKTSLKDLKQMRQLQEKYKSFKATYEEAHPKLQAKFSSAMKKLEEQNKAFAKLALVVKARKQSLAQQLADTYLQKSENRLATPEEIEAMQNSLKEAINYRNIGQQEGDEKKLNLKAVYMTARHKGPNFEPRHTDVVFNHLQAS